MRLWETAKIPWINWNCDSETMPVADVPAWSAWTGISTRQPRDPKDFGGSEPVLVVERRDVSFLRLMADGKVHYANRTIRPFLLIVGPERWLGADVASR